MTVKSFILKHKLLYELYFFICNKKINKKKILRNIEKLSSSYKGGDVKDFIVSLTSYGERIEELEYTLYSLITQTVLPQKVVVYLAEADYEIALRREILKKFEHYFVEYRKTEDIKSYKKLLPALRDFPDKVIITTDDDIFYEKHCLERLWRSHSVYPNDVIANIGKIPVFSSDALLSYQYWPYAKHNKFSFGLPIGCGGVLYPVNNFNSVVNNRNLFLKLAPTGDDLWFWVMTLLNHKKTMILGQKSEKLKYVNIYREYNLISSKTLNSKNIGENQNDKQIQNLVSFFNIDMKQVVKV